MKKETIEKFMPLMQAMLEGKTIQYCFVYGRKWVDVEEICVENDVSLYRIKAEPKYRPFKNADECWAEMQKHQPFGWVRYKTSGVYSFIAKVDKDRCYFAVNEYWSFDTISKMYTFADGTPFGIKEGE